MLIAVTRAWAVAAVWTLLLVLSRPTVSFFISHGHAWRKPIRRMTWLHPPARTMLTALPELVELTRAHPVSELFTACVVNDSDARSLIVGRRIRWHEQDELDIPLLGVDMSSVMSSAFTNLYEPIPVGMKGKLLLSCVRGVGSGKTRLLEEIAIAILKDNGHKDKFNIILPITFNSDWELTDSEVDSARVHCQTADHVAVHAICARILSVVFDIELNEVIRTLNTLNCDGSKSMLLTVLDHVVEAIRHANPTRELQGIMFAVDESVKLADELGQSNPYALFLGTILGYRSKFTLAVGGLNVRTAIVMTALHDAVLRSRPFQPLYLAEIINAKEVVDKSWAPRIAALGGVVSTQTRAYLVVMASSLCQIPQQVAVYGKALGRIVATTAAILPGKDVDVTAAMLGQALNETARELARIQSEDLNPWTEVEATQDLIAMFSSEEVGYKSETTNRLFRNSIFTNQIMGDPRDCWEMRMFVPQASPLMIAVTAHLTAVDSQHSSYNSSLQLVEHDTQYRTLPYLMDQSFQQLVFHSTHDVNLSTTAIMDDITSWWLLWLEILLRAGRENTRERRGGPFRLGQLLPGVLLPRAIGTVAISKEGKYGRFDMKGKNSHEDINHTVDVLTAIVVSEEQPLAIIRAPPGEGYEAILAVYRPNDDPVAIVIKVQCDGDVIDLDWSQAAHFYDTIQPACCKTASPPNSAARAIQTGNVAFVYMDNQALCPPSSRPASAYSTNLDAQGVVVRTCIIAIYRFAAFYFPMTLCDVKLL